jgi:RNA polymerase sigma-70 factor (ECF subfamily)
MQESPTPETGERRMAEFERTAMQYADQLYRVALRLTRESGQAEDLVQETYLQGWRAFDRFTPGTNLRAWLFKIMFNTFYSHLRRKHELAPLDDATVDTLVYEAPIPERLTDEEVIAAIEGLEAKYKLPILLADVEELSYKEISAALDWPIGTVMSRLHRGRKLLRAELTNLQRGLRSLGIRHAAGDAA